MTLPDATPLEDVKNSMVALFPELARAEVTETKDHGKKCLTFKVQAGEKG